MFFAPKPLINKEKTTTTATTVQAPAPNLVPSPMPAPQMETIPPTPSNVAVETPVMTMPEAASPAPETVAPAPVMPVMPLTSEPLEKPMMDDSIAPAMPTVPAQVIETPDVADMLPKIDDVWFSDLYFTPEKIAYVHDKKSAFGLKVFEAEDLMDFHKALDEGFQGSSSYSIHFGDSLYRIERIKTVTGIHYTARRMPKTVPDVYQLGMPEILVNHLTSLNKATGLILLCGPTGMGKTTTATALLKFFLENEGGFAYTIEDPPEMPMDGLYHSKKGGLGLCKQTEVVNNNWELGLRSALRSKPRYILVGETRTAETAAELLRAATSGHLVISTIHANNLEDGLTSLIKYAAASGMNEGLASDLLARGILGVIHQKLTGTVKLMPTLHYCFANPDPMEADQMRMSIRDGKINLATLMEAQMAKMIQGKPLFVKV